MDRCPILDPMLEHRISWKCYRSNKADLVYFSCNKCASTLYDLLFERLSWQITDTTKIDWKKDSVFGHIRHPLVRHRKGIVEGIFLYHADMIPVFLNDLKHMEFLANVSSIDPHSYTIYRMLGNRAQAVRWIPIDTTLDHKQEVFKLLQAQGEDISAADIKWFYDLGTVWESTIEKKIFFEQLMTVPTPPQILLHIDFDVCLYAVSLSGTPATRTPMYDLRMKQLAKQGLDQEAARIIADQEVCDSRYLYWKFD